MQIFLYDNNNVRNFDKIKLKLQYLIIKIGDKFEIFLHKSPYSTLLPQDILRKIVRQIPSSPYILIDAKKSPGCPRNRKYLSYNIPNAFFVFFPRKFWGRLHKFILEAFEKFQDHTINSKIYS